MRRNPMLGFNLFMTRRMVIEKYGITPELEAEIFGILKPVGGSGANAQYLESRVDDQLEKYFASKDRPKGTGGWFKEDEEDRMAQTWAETVSEATDGVMGIAPLEPLLVDEKTASELLGVSRRTIFDLEKRGVLKSKQIGKRKLYSVTHLRDFAEGKVA